MVWDRGQIAFFYKWIFSFPSTNYWRPCLPQWVFLATLSNISYPHTSEFTSGLFLGLHRSLGLFMPAPYSFDYFDYCVLVARSCLTLSNPVDCSPQGSSIHGILQVRILGWVVIYKQILHYVNHQGSSITTALLYILLLGSVMPPVSFSLGTAWTNWGLLGFYTNFGIVFSISVKNVIEILIEITLNA